MAAGVTICHLVAVALSGLNDKSVMPEQAARVKMYGSHPTGVAALGFAVSCARRLVDCGQHVCVG